MMVLKVMAGDKFNLRVSSWYRSGGTTPGAPVNLLPDLLQALAGSVSSIAAPSHAGAFATELQNNTVFTGGITQFLNNKSYTSGKPKAYLNWILLDEQFKFLSAGSGAEQVPDESAFGTTPHHKVHEHVKSNMPVSKNGYLYIFVSNETPDMNVYFDNLQVTHIRGPLLEETHYYPFGLTMAGISSKALNNAMENRYKFNGATELNSTFDVNLYETHFRSYDPQIGRFHQTDPLTESTPSWSAYSFVQNNPLLYLDPLGLDTSKNYVVLPGITVTKPPAYKLGYWWEYTNPQYGQAGSLPPGPGSAAEQRVLDGLAELDRVSVKETKDGQIGGGTGLTTVNNWLMYAGYAEGGIGAVQIGMLSYRQSLEINSKIGTFGRFRSTFSTLGVVGKGLNRAGYLGAGLNTYIDYKSMQNGEIGAGRFAYRTTGTLSSIFGGAAIGAQMGGSWGAVGGAVIGGGFWAGEQMYRGFMYGVQQMSIFLNNVENGLKSGWVPGR